MFVANDRVSGDVMVCRWGRGATRGVHGPTTPPRNC